MCVCVSAALVVSLYRGPWAVRACVMRDGGRVPLSRCAVCSYTRYLVVDSESMVCMCSTCAPYVGVRSSGSGRSMHCNASLRNRASSIFVRFVCSCASREEVVACAQDNTRGLTNGGTRTSQVQDQVRESRESAKPQATKEKRIERKIKGIRRRRRGEELIIGRRGWLDILGAACDQASSTWTRAHNRHNTTERGEKEECWSRAQSHPIKSPLPRNSGNRVHTSIFSLSPSAGPPDSLGGGRRVVR